MHLDVSVDDELLPCQSNAVIGQEALLERLLRRAQVHHDFCPCPRQCFQVNLFLVVAQNALVNGASGSMRAINGYLLSVVDHLCRVLRSHDARDAKLAAHNRGVAVVDNHWREPLRKDDIRMVVGYGDIEDISNGFVPRGDNSLHSQVALKQVMHLSCFPEGLLRDVEIFVPSRLFIA